MIEVLIFSCIVFNWEGACPLSIIRKCINMDIGQWTWTFIDMLLLSGVLTNYGGRGLHQDFREINFLVVSDKGE